MKPSKISPLAESRGVCRRCAVSWKWARAWKKKEEKNKDSMWHVLYRRICFSSRDIWLHQLEISHRRCDKCLYSQFTSFCFSLLLDCSLASSSPRVCFSHFSLSPPRHFSSRVGACARHTHIYTHTKAQSLTKLIIGKIHSWSNSHPKTSWQTLKHPCDLCVCVCSLSLISTLWHTITNMNVAGEERKECV